MIRRDLPAGVYPALLFALAARCVVGGAGLDGLFALLACGAYFWLFLYSFCLDNQITGVAEDRLNKPDRVIPSGRLPLAGPCSGNGSPPPSCSSSAPASAHRCRRSCGSR